MFPCLESAFKVPTRNLSPATGKVMPRKGRSSEAQVINKRRSPIPAFDHMWLGFQTGRRSCPQIGHFLKNAPLPSASHCCFPDSAHRWPISIFSREASAAESLGRRLAAGMGWEKAQSSLHPLWCGAQQSTQTEHLHNGVRCPDSAATLFSPASTVSHGLDHQTLYKPRHQALLLLINRF